MTKLAISLPDETYRGLERLRRGRKLSRSAAVRLALDAWIGQLEREREVLEYVEGYRRVPEPEVDARWLTASPWSPWEQDR